MSAYFVLDPAAVADCDSDSRQGVIDALAARLAKVYDLDEAQIGEALDEREKLGSTGFGRAVAIPHARVAGLKRPVCAVLRLRTPVDFAAADGLPVDLVFGLLSPADSGATHLHALAAISRMMRDDELRERIGEAPDCEAAYSILVSVSTRDAA